MLLLVLFSIGAVGALAYAVWPAVENARTRKGGPVPADAGTSRARGPESLEGVLVAQLAAAAITRRQYIHAMEGLAARDDLRHPLAVPPETGSAA